MWIVGLIILFILPAFVIGWLNGSPTAFLFFDENAMQGATVGLSPYLMSVAMLLGVIFGSFYEALRVNPDGVALTALRQALRGSFLYRALLASPILFGGVYAIAKTNPDPVVALVFAFQNGFFCETILRQRLPEMLKAGEAKAGSPKPDAPS